MNRRQRRIHKRLMRRIGVVLASVAMLATTVGLGGVASANGKPGHYNQCSPGPNTTGFVASGERNETIGKSWNACD